MNGCHELNRLTRRGFLRAAASLGAGAAILGDPLLHSIASTYAQTPQGTGNLLVLCELNGGFDALSLLAPFQNQVYRDRRPQLALAADTVTPLPDEPSLGISNLLPTFIQQYQAGNLAIVQQVAYPDGNGSHFESQEIFEFGVRNLGTGEGTRASWYERLRERYFDEAFGVLDTRRIGDPQRYGYPDRTYRQAARDAFSRLATLKAADDGRRQPLMDTYQRIDTLGETLRAATEEFESVGEARGQFYRAAQLASADLGTQVIRLAYGGFDTHGEQDQANARLMPALDGEFNQFVSDLQRLGLWERTCICFYSEFGRRNEENGSPGTDHGYGGHMMLVGPGVHGGLHGQAVTSADLRQDSLPYYVDFRAVFASCIHDWLGFDPQPVFNVGGESYDATVGSDLFG